MKENHENHHQQHHSDPVCEEVVIILIEEVDLEECARAGKHPPKAKVYRIRVDKEYFKVPYPSRTGREILQIASKNPPENFILTQKLHGGVVKTIELNEVVDFTKPGIERFNTLPREVTEG